MHVTRLGARFNRCPKSWLIFEAREASGFLNDWGWLEKYQVLPKAGGLLDQDPRWVEAIDLIVAERQRVEALENA